MLVRRDVYGGRLRMVSEVLWGFGIEDTFVEMRDLNEVKKGIEWNRKVI